MNSTFSDPANPHAPAHGIDAGEPASPFQFVQSADASRATFDLVGLWALIYRNRVVVLAIIMVAFLAGIASIIVMPRIYQARASLQIEQQVAKVLGTEDRDPEVTGIDAERFLQTQVDIITSRSIAKRVSDQMGLAANDGFLSAMGVSRSLTGPDMRREDMVLDTLDKNLSIEVKPDSRVVGVLFKSRDPKLAAQIANAFSQTYMEGNIQRKFSASSYSLNFLQNQLAITKARLEASERALIDYARAARLIDASAGSRATNQNPPPSSLITSNLVDLNQAYAAAETARLQAMQRWQQAQATPLLSLPEVLSNDAVQHLLQRRIELEAELQELRKRLKPDHPTVVQQVAQIDEIRRETNALAQSILNSIKNQYQTADLQEKAIAEKVGTLKNDTLSEQERTVRYNILNREVETNRQLFDGLLQRYKTVSAESGVANNNVTLIDPAEVPQKPISPKPLLNLALALALGISLAIAFAFLREQMIDSVTDPREVETRLNLPLLGVVPEDETGTPRESLSNPKSEIAEAYHAIRTAIELSSNQGLVPSLLITSSTEAEGKTTTSYALARDFAALGRRVLAVDADMRRPSLHRMFDITQTETGLSTVLAQLTRYEDAVVHTAIANVDLLPSGPLPPDPASLLAGSALTDLFAALNDSYDIVIIDGPPVLALADANQIAAAAAATLFVIAVRSTHLGNARNQIARIRRMHDNIIGCVVTKYNSRKTGYGSITHYNYKYRYDETVST